MIRLEIQQVCFLGLAEIETQAEMIGLHIGYVGASKAGSEEGHIFCILKLSL